jgi:tetratricopeptide (TPR) repeat protein
VPDSAGALALPAMDYPYFDLAAHHYRQVPVAAASIPVAPSGESAVAAALPPGLMDGDAPALSRRLVHDLPDWLWIALILVPPLAALARGRRPSFGKRRAPLVRHTRLREAEEELDALVRNLVPDPDRRSGTRLVAAVRAAGADAELASRVAAARERLLARRYGPGLSVAEDPVLAAEVHELVRRLGGSLRGWASRGTAILLLTVAAGNLAQAHSPVPEELYREGSLAAAAAGFARRTEESPAVAAHWYNLGASYYRLGREGRAEAAWLQARRLTPRQGAIRRALALTPPPDATSARWFWSPPVTPEELLLLGSIGWLAGWIGWWLRPRLRDRWSALLILSLCGIAGGLALRAWYRRPLAVVLDRTTLRLSPHGLAPAVAPLEPGSAVRIVRRTPGWLMIRAPGRQEGWLAEEAVAAVGS